MGAENFAGLVRILRRDRNHNPGLRFVEEDSGIVRFRAGIARYLRANEALWIETALGQGDSQPALAAIVRASNEI